MAHSSQPDSRLADPALKDWSAILDHPDLPTLLANDPELARELQQLQQQIRETAQASIQELNKALRDTAAKDNTSSPSSNAPAKQLTSVAALKAASAQRESAARSVKEMASHMAFGMMANAGNPAWNPSDAETYQSPEKSLLLRLLDLPIGPES